MLSFHMLKFLRNWPSLVLFTIFQPDYFYVFEKKDRLIPLCVQPAKTHKIRPSVSRNYLKNEGTLYLLPAYEAHRQSAQKNTLPVFKC